VFFEAGDVPRTAPTTISTSATGIAIRMLISEAASAIAIQMATT